MSYRQILQAALALPESKRGNLVKRLRASLNNDDEIEFRAEWAAEIRRRDEEIDQGKTKPLSAADFKRFMDKLRKSARASK
jgi:putative addiction module component (TIGR02574 family)